jgi:hypothetical protein
LHGALFELPEATASDCPLATIDARALATILRGVPSDLDSCFALTRDRASMMTGAVTDVAQIAQRVDELRKAHPRRAWLTSWRSLMSDAEVMVALLRQMLGEPLRRKELVCRFQELAWAGLDASTPMAVQTVLRDLASDLDFFEPTRSVRTEDANYYVIVDSRRRYVRPSLRSATRA